MDRISNTNDIELMRIGWDIDRCRQLARANRHKPRVVKSMNNLIYALIVQTHKIKYGYGHDEEF